MFSCIPLLSKLASRETFFSSNFLLFYGLSLKILFIYSLIWQILLQKLPLTTAYSNRATVVIWGIAWGYLFFDENITIAKSCRCCFDCLRNCRDW
jgi:drug/metabolite transporter (DMT)-like permease